MYEYCIEELINIKDTEEIDNTRHTVLNDAY
jgi:hypothetical protein